MDDTLGHEVTRALRLNRRLGRGYIVLGVVTFFGIMFMPMILLHDASVAYTNTLSDRATEVTVGLAAVLRAMARRFFQSGARTLVSTAGATAARAVARVMTRRFMRSSVRTLAFTQASAQTRLLQEPIAPQRPAVALIAGVIALMASFWAILALLPVESSAALTQGLTSRAVAAATLAALPLLIYAATSGWAAPRFGVQLNLSTRVDGLLLQAYFTGAGSFLPITTDVEYQGDARGRAWTAGLSLGSLLLSGAALKGLAFATGWWGLSFASAMFLLYAFVFSFPLQPLGGRDVWEHSRLAWAGLFGLILFTFQMTVPESLTFFL